MWLCESRGSLCSLFFLGLFCKCSWFSRHCVGECAFPEADLEKCSKGRAEFETNRPLITASLSESHYLLISVLLDICIFSADDYPLLSELCSESSGFTAVLVYDLTTCDMFIQEKLWETNATLCFFGHMWCF